MAEKVRDEQSLTTPQIAPKVESPTLTENPFLTAFRQQTTSFAVGVVAESSKKPKLVGGVLYIDQEGNAQKALLYTKEAIGAQNWLNKDDLRAINKGDKTVVIQYYSEGIPFYAAVGSLSRYGKDRTEFSVNITGTVNKMLGEGYDVKAVYIVNKSYGCLDLVNDSLGAGGFNKLHYNTGRTLAAAIDNGNAIIERTSNFQGINGERELRRFFSSAHEGDVIVYLSPIRKDKIKEYEKETDGDKVIYVDGSPYTVHHTAIYGGQSDQGPLTILQAHINSGDIASESLSLYSENRDKSFPITAIISVDHLKKSKMIAMEKEGSDTTLSHN